MSHTFTSRLKRLYQIACRTAVIPASLLLVACGGGQSGDSASSPSAGTGNNVSDSSCQSSANKIEGSYSAIEFGSSDLASDDRLPCEKGDGNAKFCDLQIYQVMVESFQNGDPNLGYGVGWGPSSHQGDLQGVLDSLDYIQDLGFNTIWLTPIFDSMGSDKIDATGYFAKNYFKIDPNFGDEGLFRALVDEIHDRDMYILLDGVFGHHKGTVVASPNGLKPTDCVAQGDVGMEAKYPDDLAFYQEVINYWMDNFKIDGWRLDQAYQVPLDSWQVLQDTVDSAAARNGTLGYIVAEIWSGEGKWLQRYAYGDNDNPALHSAFDFPLRYKLVQVFAGQEDSSVSWATDQNAKDLNGDWGLKHHNYLPDHAIPNLMIGNHDLVRFGDLIERYGIATPEDDEYWLRHKAAMSFLYTFSGPITVYYGEEIGDEVPNFAAQVRNNCGNFDRCDDHVSRSDGKVAGNNYSLDSNEQDLHDYIQTLAKVRSENAALYAGSRVELELSSSNNVLALLKQAGSNKVLYILNMAGSSKDIDISNEVDIEADSLKDLVSNQRHYPQGDSFSVSVPAYSGVLLKLY